MLESEHTLHSCLCPNLTARGEFKLKPLRGLWTAKKSAAAPGRFLILFISRTGPAPSDTSQIAKSVADGQQLREAQLVPVWIGDVKETLTPWCISRGLNDQSLSLERPVVHVHVINSKNSSTPPRELVPPARHQVDESFAGPQAAEGCTLVAVKQLESELPVEFNGTSHIVDGERHCTDVPDHTVGLRLSLSGSIIDSGFVMALSFASDIRPLFRDSPDVDSMQGYGLDLSSYADVKARAAEIYEALANGSMPCDEAWPKERLELFKHWMDEGFAP
jgi:hypothetical protein